MNDQKSNGINPAGSPELAPVSCSETPWPTDEGIWMGWIDSGIGWFPMQTMYLRDDLPSKEEIEEERRSGVKWIGKPLVIVAQWPESETSWPYTFQQCHPVKRWRRPTEDETRRAMIFYGKSPNI